MERFKHMKETLLECAEGQMGHLETVNANELGAVIDMLKDLEEAIYYCTITEAMHEGPAVTRSTSGHEAIAKWMHEEEEEEEGLSAYSRKAYMEHKKLKHDAATTMRSLEKYVKELSEDIMEMLEEASAEEKQYISKKMATLATKIE